MKYVLAVIGALSLAGPGAFAADIFVRGTQSSELSSTQRDKITDTVKRSVRRMPEHTLVQSEGLADFVLHPTVFVRGDEQILRVEKYKDGELIGQGESVIARADAPTQNAYDVTEAALGEDLVANSENRSLGVDGVEERFDDSNASALNRRLGERQSATEDSTTMDVTDVDATVSGSSTESMNDSTATASNFSGTPSAGGDVRAPSPAFGRDDKYGFLQLGVGPSFSTGLGTDSLLYDINVGYIVPMNELVSAKAFGDINIANGSDASRLINLGLGAEIYPWGTFNGGQPYVVGDVGYAFARDDDQRILDAPAIGAGAGFKFAAQQLNMDVNVHYSVMTGQIQDTNPSVLGLRAAINF